MVWKSFELSCIVFLVFVSQKRYGTTGTSATCSIKYLLLFRELTFRKITRASITVNPFRTLCPQPQGENSLLKWHLDYKNRPWHLDFRSLRQDIYKDQVELMFSYPRLVVMRSPLMASCCNMSFNICINCIFKKLIYSWRFFILT